MRKLKEFIEENGWVAKIILCAIFVLKLVAISITADHNESPSVYQGKTLQERMQVIERLSRDITQKAEDNLDYSPDDYYQDFILIREKEIELKAYAGFFFSSFHVIQEYAGRPFKNQAELTSAWMSGQEKYLPIIRGQERRMKVQGNNEGGWKNFFRKLFLFYLTAMSLAFAYLLILVIQDLQECDKKFCVLNLFPLAFSTLLYPVVFGILIFDFLKKGLVAIEYSRTRRYLLTPFSGRELEGIERLAREISWREIFDYFPRQGMVYRHSFAAGLAAVIILSLLPIGNAQASAGKFSIRQATAIDQLDMAHSARDGPAIGPQLQKVEKNPGTVAILPLVQEFVFLPVVVVIEQARFLTLPGIPRAIPHIPEVSPYLYGLFEKLKSKVKEIRNEKNFSGNVCGVAAGGSIGFCL